MMTVYSKRNRENYPRECFDNKKKKAGLKFNPGLVLTGIRKTGPSTIISSSFINNMTRLIRTLSRAPLMSALT